MSSSMATSPIYREDGEEVEYLAGDTPLEEYPIGCPHEVNIPEDQAEDFRRHFLCQRWPSDTWTDVEMPQQCFFSPRKVTQWGSSHIW